MFGKLFSDVEKKSVWFYTRLFFFMIIPVFGLFYTMYFAFIEEKDTDLRRIARGAIIVRILAITLALLGLTVLAIYIMPNIEEWLNNGKLLMRLI